MTTTVETPPGSVRPAALSGQRTGLGIRRSLAAMNHQATGPITGGAR